jgi:uncharacterized membrane protein YhaH (DUF805 family)/cold shock CspA family protein
VSRGEVIYFDRERGTGFISGDDGNRYVFDVGDLVAGEPVAKGTKVEFQTDGDQARQITPRGRLQPAAQPVASHAEVPGKPELSRPAVTPGVFNYFRYCVTEGYVRFRGRARRREYWSFVLISLIGFAIVGGLGFAIGTALGYNEAEEPTVASLFIGLFWLYLILPSLAVLVRRVHDIGLSGWFILLGFVPMIGSLIILVFTLVGSQKHENKWGPVPTGIHVT